jgi:hypothetical protein
VSYWTLLDYYEAMGTYGRIGQLRCYRNLQYDAIGTQQ